MASETLLHVKIWWLTRRQIWVVRHESQKDASDSGGEGLGSEETGPSLRAPSTSIGTTALPSPPRSL